MVAFYCDVPTGTQYYTPTVITYRVTRSPYTGTMSWDATASSTASTIFDYYDYPLPVQKVGTIPVPKHWRWFDKFRIYAKPKPLVSRSLYSSFVTKPVSSNSITQLRKNKRKAYLTTLLG